MEFKCRKPKDYTIIHEWFAWHPVKLTNSETCVWLETVYRIGKFSYFGYDISIEFSYYKIPNDD